MKVNTSLNIDLKISFKCYWKWLVFLDAFPHLFFWYYAPDNDWKSAISSASGRDGIFAKS